VSDQEKGRDPTRQPADVRRAALEVLVDTQTEEKFVDNALAAKIGEFATKDRHLLQEIAYGSMRHQNTLDRLLRHYVKFPVHQQRPPICWALRIGAYQIVYLGRIPVHAAVHQTLEGLKKMPGVKQRDVGFVNAVLHKLSKEIHRKQQEPPENPDDPNVLPIRHGYCHFRRPILPLAKVDEIDHLAAKYSHPRWLVHRWLARLGSEETRKLLEANNRVPFLWVRVTKKAPSRDEVLARLTEEGFEVSAGPTDSSIDLRTGGDLGASETLRDGWIQVQDVTAARIGAVLDPPPVARVLDLCAAPGGKAAQLLENLTEGGKLVAADRAEDKLPKIVENLERVGGNFETKALPDDPAEIDLGETFTHVLIDAPCSNTGVLGRRPDARWRIQKTDFDSLNQLQSALLEAALRHLEPGGRLVYATCSIEPAENEERVSELMKAHPDLVEIDTKLFLPHRMEGDGGYFSLLRKGL